ncbi:phosphoenolpyruvate-utilizing N-terminal domain-containing protein [Cupriavidus basilensis]
MSPITWSTKTRLEAEVERLRSCPRGRARPNWPALKRDLPARCARKRLGAFLDVHAMILDDEVLCARARRHLIRQRRYNAEWALTTRLEELMRAVR